MEEGPKLEKVPGIYSFAIRAEFGSIELIKDMPCVKV